MEERHSNPVFKIQIFLNFFFVMIIVRMPKYSKPLASDISIIITKAKPYKKTIKVQKLQDFFYCRSLHLKIWFLVSY